MYWYSPVLNFFLSRLLSRSFLPLLCALFSVVLEIWRIDTMLVVNERASVCRMQVRWRDWCSKGEIWTQRCDLPNWGEIKFVWNIVFCYRNVQNSETVGIDSSPSSVLTLKTDSNIFRLGVGSKLLSAFDFENNRDIFQRIAYGRPPV